MEVVNVIKINQSTLVSKFSQNMSELYCITVKIMYQVNNSGRVYRSGKALDGDLCRLIIDKCLAAGGNRLTGELPTTFMAIAKAVQVTKNMVSKIWQQYCNDLSDCPLQRGGDFCSKLTTGDLELRS
jgi:hypothetical protein